VVTFEQKGKNDVESGFKKKEIILWPLF